MTSIGDRLNALDGFQGRMGAAAGLGEHVKIKGVYRWQLFKDASRSELIAEGEEHNVVTYEGQNQLLAAALQGSSYSVTGPYMGLISSTSYSAVVVGDTQASHAGWLEAGGAHAPTYSGSRPTISFSAPSGGVIASSASGSFTFTGGGTVQGGFMIFGAGAVNTLDNTSGKLLSASAFGTPQPVINGNVLSVSYSLTL